MNKLLQVITVLFLILLTGCVVGRRTVDLPIQNIPEHSGGKGEIFIGSIEDNRVFQNKPSDPSIPSIDGDVHSLTPKEKGMMIGRQRGAFGRALGDIALPADDSVVERTRRLLEEGFRSRGYSITSDSSAPTSASAKIGRFWAWYTPGIWMQRFQARVYCTITLSKSDDTTTIDVQGYGSNRGQIVSNANWQLAYQRAFQDFLSKLDSKLAQAGY
jgi:hypothetical protein